MGYIASNNGLTVTWKDAGYIPQVGEILCVCIAIPMSQVRHLRQLGRNCFRCFQLLRGDAMIYILYYFLPFILLYICFPWYASVHHALLDNKLSKVDLAVQLIPFLCMGALDIACNILSSPLFLEIPFRHGNFTLSQRCIYWYHNPQARWQYSIARAVKVLTDKYEQNHIA